MTGSFGTGYYAWRRLCIVLVLTAGLQPCSSAIAVEITPSGAPVVLFDQEQDRCPQPDGPDAPARAFRDSQGQIVLFAPSARNRAFVGASLTTLQRDCRPRFEAGNRAEPEMLDDRSWIHSLYSTDGRTVFALASAGFIPARHGIACDAGAARTDCWYNGIVSLKSSNGGQSFSYDFAPPRHVFLGPPSPYDPNIRHPAGYITITNFVTWGDFVYTMVRWRDPSGRGSGMCLLRAAKADLGLWETLGRDGRYQLTTERRADGWHDLRTGCTVIAGLNPGVRSLVLHEASNTFITIHENKAQNGPDGGEGFFYQTSRDLLVWSPPKLLLPGAMHSTAYVAMQEYQAYPSILDAGSHDRNFGSIGDHPTLIFTRIVPVLGTDRPRRSRQLVAIGLSISP